MTTLEADFRYVRRDLDEIRESLKVLPTLATKKDLVAYTIAGLTIVLTIVGLLLGGMGWLETRASRVDAKVEAAQPQPLAPPIIIQIPATATAKK